ncbi:MAG: DUF1559 domain-containing protein [Verrucomicrobiae bacterium]|nr:DUF1559 domain-containing protein [Verrucomicrobiae bacterium]
MKTRVGFTLVEMLVVVAVVTILATLLAPGLATAKGRVRTVSCLNNLRQWGLATHLYASDHDDYLPAEGSPSPGPNATNTGWYVLLPRQLGIKPYHEMPWRTNPAVNPGSTIWLCPANPRRSNGLNLFHYCLNENVNGTGENNRPVRLSSINSPALVVWLFDSKNLPAVGGWSFVHTQLHLGGANISFLDAHVKRFPNTEYWDFVQNRARTNSPLIRWHP